MSQALNMPTLAVMFDIKKLEQRFGVGNYLTQAWKVLWRTVDTRDLRRWSGTILLEGDTEGKPQGCCIAVQSLYEPLLRQLREVVSQSSEYRNVADFPRFLEGERARSQPLLNAGMIDFTGNIEGETTYCSRPALDAVRAEQESLDPKYLDSLLRFRRVVKQSSVRRQAARGLTPAKPVKAKPRKKRASVRSKKTRRKTEEYAPAGHVAAAMGAGLLLGWFGITWEDSWVSERIWACFLAGFTGGSTGALAIPMLLFARSNPRGFYSALILFFLTWVFTAVAAVHFGAAAAVRAGEVGLFTILSIFIVMLVLSPLAWFITLAVLGLLALLGDSVFSRVRRLFLWQ